MNNKNIYVEDFYQTTLQNDLSSSWDLEIQVSNPPKNKKWFLILTPENQSTREGVFYHNVDWNTIYVKEINRRELKEHYTWEKIQINDTSLIFNYLSEVSYTAFYAEKTGDLSVTIWGWLILKWLEEIEISDTDLTLDDNTTTYFYIDLTDNTIKGSTTASWIVLWEITTAGWKITSIWYKKHWISIWNFIENIAKTSSDWLIDTYTITLSDWSTKTFEVTNGRGINSIDKTNTDALTDTYTITYNDDTTSTFDVVNGRGVDSIDKTSSDWLTDTYTITYNDDTTSTFDVANWHDIKFKWEYDDTVDYIKYDSVYLNNKTYVALEDNTWENPETSDSWQILISWDVLSLPVYTVSNVTEDREFDADDYTTDELADVLWTLINDVTKWIKWNDWLWVPAGWTTGQILAKVSDTDNDTEWKDEAQWGHLIQDEWTDLDTRAKLNFSWVNVTVTDDSDNDTTQISIETGNVQSDYNETDNTKDEYIKNKPDLSVYQTNANMIDEDDMTSDSDTKYPTQQSVKAYVDNKNYAKLETVQIAWEQVEGTKFFEYNADGDKTVGNVKISLEVANEWADFIVKAYKNWTDLSKDVTITDGGWTAVNNRYIASLAMNETLADWDVFELKINQVWSDVAGSDFLALINIS